MLRVVWGMASSGVVPESRQRQAGRGREDDVQDAHAGKDVRTTSIPRQSGGGPRLPLALPAVTPGPSRPFLRRLAPARRCGRQSAEGEMLWDDSLNGLHGGDWLSLGEDRAWIVAEARTYRVSPAEMQRWRANGLWINLTLRGTGTVTDPEGRTHPLQPGSLVRRMPGELSGARYDAGYAEIFWGCDPATCAHLARAGLVWPERVMAIALDLGLIAEFQQLCRRIAAPLNEHEARMRLFDLLGFTRGIYDRARRGHVRGSWDGTIAEAKAVIDHDLACRTSLAALAQRLDCSYPSLRAEFRRAVGMSLGAYRGQRRMEAARRMLLHHTVGQVARALGYADAALFTRQFRRRLGVTPSEFRLRRSRDGALTPRSRRPRSAARRAAPGCGRGRASPGSG
jgi:AraC-like DNA-binding protein